MNDFEDFCLHIKKMRSAQKEYFRTRSKEALITSKALERQVDDYLVLSGIALNYDDI